MSRAMVATLLALAVAGGAADLYPYMATCLRADGSWRAVVSSYGIDRAYPNIICYGKATAGSPWVTMGTVATRTQIGGTAPLSDWYFDADERTYGLAAGNCLQETPTGDLLLSIRRDLWDQATGPGPHQYTAWGTDWARSRDGGWTWEYLPAAPLCDGVRTMWFVVAPGGQMHVLAWVMGSENYRAGAVCRAVYVLGDANTLTAMAASEIGRVQINDRDATDWWESWIGLLPTGALIAHLTTDSPQSAALSRDGGISWGRAGNDTTRAYLYGQSYETTLTAGKGTNDYPPTALLSDGRLAVLWRGVRDQLACADVDRTSLWFRELAGWGGALDDIVLANDLPRGRVWTAPDDVTLQNSQVMFFAEERPFPTVPVFHALVSVFRQSRLLSFRSGDEGATWQLVGDAPLPR